MDFSVSSESEKAMDEDFKACAMVSMDVVRASCSCRLWVRRDSCVAVERDGVAVGAAEGKSWVEVVWAAVVEDGCNVDVWLIRARRIDCSGRCAEGVGAGGEGSVAISAVTVSSIRSVCSKSSTRSEFEVCSSVSFGVSSPSKSSPSEVSTSCDSYAAS